MCNSKAIDVVACRYSNSCTYKYCKIEKVAFWNEVLPQSFIDAHGAFKTIAANVEATTINQFKDRLQSVVQNNHPFKFEQPFFGNVDFKVESFGYKVSDVIVDNIIFGNLLKVNVDNWTLAFNNAKYEFVSPYPYNTYPSSPVNESYMNILRFFEQSAFENDGQNLKTCDDLLQLAKKSLMDWRQL